MKSKKIIFIALVLALTFALSSFGSVAFAAPARATIYIEVNEGVARILLCLGTTFDASLATTYSSSTSISAMANGNYTWMAYAESGYTLNQSSGSLKTVAGANYISPTASKNAVYTLTVTKNTGISSITVVYGSSSKTFTSSGTLSINQGTSVSWTATAAPGYNLSSSSGSFTMTSNNTVAPTATVKSYKVTAYWSPSDATPNFTWTLAWASGKALSGAVTDYVTMTVASDGKSVTLTFKKAFTGAEMILTCYATNNPSVKATCTVTCS